LSSQELAAKAKEKKTKKKEKRNKNMVLRFHFLPLSRSTVGRRVRASYWNSAIDTLETPENVSGRCDLPFVDPPQRG
jgi:hypothetical protein